MFYLNGHEVAFNDNRLQLVLQDRQFINTVIWQYEDDSDLFKLSLIDSALTQMGELYKLHVAYLPYSNEKEPYASFALDNIWRYLSILHMQQVVLLDAINAGVTSSGNSYGMNVRPLKFNFAETILKERDPKYFIAAFKDKKTAEHYNYKSYQNYIILDEFEEVGHVDMKLMDIYFIDNCNAGTSYADLWNVLTEKGYRGRPYLIVTHAIKDESFNQVAKTFKQVYVTNTRTQFEMQPTVKVTDFKTLL